MGRYGQMFGRSTFVLVVTANVRHVMLIIWVKKEFSVVGVIVNVVHAIEHQV